jgi:hypothetical protein
MEFLHPAFADDEGEFSHEMIHAADVKALRSNLDLQQ